MVLVGVCGRGEAVGGDVLDRRRGFGVVLEVWRDDVDLERVVYDVVVGRRLGVEESLVWVWLRCVSARELREDASLTCNAGGGASLAAISA